MTDIATLGIAVDSRAVVTGATNLEKLQAAAAAAAASTDKLSAASNKSETVQRAIAAAAKRNSISYAEMEGRVNAASAAQAKLNQSAMIAAGGITNLANAAAGNGGAGSSGGSLASASDKSSSALEKLGNTLTRRVLFAYAAKEVKELAGYVWNLNGAIAATADSAQRSGLGNQAFQGLQLAAGRKGISNEDFNGAMIGFNQQIGLAKNGLGDLKTLLSSNGQTVSDTATTFGVVADLVKRAAGDTRLQFSILQQAGLPASVAFVKYMEQGAASIQKQSDAAGKLTDQQLIDAKRIDDAWNSGWVKFENWGKRAVVNVGGAMSAMASHFSSSLNAAEGGGLQESAMEVARRRLGAGQGSRMDSGSNVTDLYRGLGPTGTTGQPKPPPDPNILKGLIAQEQQRLGLLGPLAQAEDVVRQKQLEINAAALNNVGISKSQADALKLVTLAQFEMNRVNQQAAIGTFNLSAAQKAAGDQLKAWIAQGLLDPKNATQFAAAQTVAAKATEQLGEAAQIAGSKFEQLKRYQLDAANGRTTFDKFATSSLDTVVNGFGDAIMRVKSFQDAVKSMSQSVIGDLVKIALRSAIFGPAAGMLGSFASSFGPTLNATPWAFPKFASGTNSAPGGLAQVNERGGEIIDLPSGSRVIPHDVSMRMAARGGDVNIGGASVVVQGSADDKTIAQITRVLHAHEQKIAGIVKQNQSQQRYASTGVR